MVQTMSQTMKAMETSGDPLIGQTLGEKYTIQRLIGRGGVGLVYLATQRDPDREVVVKVLQPNWVSDDEAVARFEREAKRLNSLKHPNIVSMYDYGHENRRAYLVMEYLQGELLSEYVARKDRLSVEEFVPIAAQILKGMGHAHSREIMLRDIKPANIMLCERKGRANFVKILDFGLAKLLKGEQPITEEHVMGTVGYLAPEAIKGEPVDLRVDVYALGVLFYYMLAGRLPFEGDNNASIFYKTINEPPPRLENVVPDSTSLPKGLADLIHKCLEKDRDNRPHDADAIVEMLIDVVPAALFRLPRAGSSANRHTASHSAVSNVPPGFGNTGMMELLGTDQSPSAVHTPVDGGRPGLRAVTSPQHSVETTPSTAIPLDAITGATRPGIGLLAGSVLAGALMAVLGGAVAMVVFLGDDDKGAGTSAAAAVAAPAVEVDEAEVKAALAKANALIDEGEFDAATEKLDEVRVSAKQVPALRSKLDRADQRLLAERLLSTAKKFEEDGDIASAVGAYRDVLEADPTNEIARSKLSRLTAKGEDEEGEEGVTYGVVSFTSRPIANLYLDGNPSGTTPFKGKVPVGKHHVKLTARGYYSWDGTIEVKEDGNVPLQVRLRGKRTYSRSRDRDVEEPPAEAAATETPEAEEAEPKPKPKPKEASSETPKKKSGPFLPTEKPPEKKKSGVFLPVGD